MFNIIHQIFGKEYHNGNLLSITPYEKNRNKKIKQNYMSSCELLADN